MYRNFKRALVLGLGKSGQAATSLLLKEDVKVCAVDHSSDDGVVSVAERLEKLGAEVRCGAEMLPAGEFDICIISPGISSTSRYAQEAEDRGIEIISELELGADRCKCDMLAITGTNGKSTMVKLCKEMLVNSGKRAEMAGNYGVPLCEIAEKTTALDWVVVEVSSFQLENMKAFHPSIGVLLNLQSDHQDRHGSMSEYLRLKASMFSNMTTEDTAIVHNEILNQVISMNDSEAKWITFGLDPDSQYSYKHGSISYSTDEAYTIAGTIFDNPIMGQTAAAAAAVASTLGLSKTQFEDTINAFEPLPHRLNEVCDINGVRFVNDSKATNLAAMAASLQMVKGNVRLIAGGLLKETDLDAIKELLVNRVRKVYLIGDCAELMESAWHNSLDCEISMTLDDAVANASREAQSGDVVLLAPGCASFDQFTSYKDRGNQFVELVNTHYKEKI